MRLFAYKVAVQFRTPLTNHRLRTEYMLVNAQSREIAARIARAYHAKHKEGELPFVDLKEIEDLGPVGEGMA